MTPATVTFRAGEVGTVTREGLPAIGEPAINLRRGK